MTANHFLKWKWKIDEPKPKQIISCLQLHSESRSINYHIQMIFLWAFIIFYQGQIDSNETLLLTWLSLTKTYLNFVPGNDAFDHLLNHIWKIAKNFCIKSINFSNNSLHNCTFNSHLLHFFIAIWLRSYHNC